MPSRQDTGSLPDRMQRSAEWLKLWETRTGSPFEKKMKMLRMVKSAVFSAINGPSRL